MKIPFLDELSQFWERRDYPSHTVDSVDLQRLEGKWYEIAAFPNWFEKNCRCTTSEYSYVGDRLEVRNTCRKDGKFASMSAKAYPVPDTGNAQLKLQYLWPMKHDYWVVARDEDYQYMVVGHPSKKYLWLMTRQPRIDDAIYDSMVRMARARGYEVENLEKTNQSCHTQ